MFLVVKLATEEIDDDYGFLNTEMKETKHFICYLQVLSPVNITCFNQLNASNL